MAPNFKLLRTAELDPRNIKWPGDMHATATEIAVRKEHVEQFVPEPILPLYNTYGPRLIVVRDKLALILPKGDEKIELPPISEQLMDWYPISILGSIKLTNKTIDKNVRIVNSTIENKLKLPQISPKYKAAKKAQALWFAKKTKFLNYSHRRQWSGVDKRFCQNIEEFAEIAALLDIEDEILMIQLLNEHHGNLLNITALKAQENEAKLTKKQEKETINEFHQLMGELCCFANVAWPGSTEEAAKKRMELVGPYTDRVFKDSEEISKKIKKAMKKKKDDKK